MLLFASTSVVRPLKILPEKLIWNSWFAAGGSNRPDVRYMKPWFVTMYNVSSMMVMPVTLPFRFWKTA